MHGVSGILSREFGTPSCEVTDRDSSVLKSVNCVSLFRVGARGIPRHGGKSPATMDPPDIFSPWRGRSSQLQFDLRGSCRLGSGSLPQFLVGDGPVQSATFMPSRPAGRCRDGAFRTFLKKGDVFLEVSAPRLSRRCEGTKFVRVLGFRNGPGSLEGLTSRAPVSREVDQQVGSCIAESGSGSGPPPRVRGARWSRL